MRYALQLDQGRELVRLARLKEVVLFVDHTFLYDSAIRNTLADSQR